MSRQSILNGKTVDQRSLEQLEKIRKEAEDTTRIAWFSLGISVVAVIVSVVSIIVAFIK